MIEKLLRLGKETAIYGLSTVVGRLLNFLLVPFYTNVLRTGEYGTVANLYAYIAFASVIFGFGMEQASMRFFREEGKRGEERTFSTAFWALLVTSAILAGALTAGAPTLSALIGLAGESGSLVRYAAIILFLDTVMAVPFAALRMQGRAATFAGLKTFSIILTVFLNYLLIVRLGLRTDGVLIANVAASGLTMVGVLFACRNLFLPVISLRLLKELVRFGIPFVPSGLAGIAIQIVDRPIVKALTGDATLGIYQANYRLGIFMMLVVNMFDYAWRPFYLSHARDADAKPLFARVLTFATIGMLTVFLGVSLFVEDLVRLQVAGKHIIHPDYWSGLSIVPWVLFAYVFNGLYLVFSAGVNIEKKTHVLPLATGLGAAVNVAANILLIPVYGIIGAAWATVLSYMVMAAVVCVPSQRWYPIPFEWRKVAGAFFSALLLYAGFRFLNPTPLTSVGLLIKCALLILFPVLLVLTGVLRRSEVVALRNLLMFRRR